MLAITAFSLKVTIQKVNVSNNFSSCFFTIKTWLKYAFRHQNIPPQMFCLYSNYMQALFAEIIIMSSINKAQNFLKKNKFGFLVYFLFKVYFIAFGCMCTFTSIFKVCETKSFMSWSL